MTHPIDPPAPAGADRPDGPGAATRTTGRTLEEDARLVGGHAWLEMRLFELTGRWASTTVEPAVAAGLAGHSRHHGWRAQLWLAHLPAIPGLDAAALVAPPTPGLGAVVSLVEQDETTATPAGGGDHDPGDSSATTVERLTAAYRVLVPRLATAYDAHLAGTTPIADRPVARTLRIVIDDLVTDWRRGEALLQGLLVDPRAVDQAATQAARLEALLT